MALDKTFSVGEVLSASDVNAHLLGIWIPIDKRVISSASPVTSVSFQSIDTTFRFFRLTYSWATSASAFLRLRLNNDSGANYNKVFLTANTTGPVSAITVTSSTEIIVHNSSSSTVTNLALMTIGKALSTAAASVVVDYSFGNSSLESMSGSWVNASSLINRIDLFVTAGNMWGVFAIEGMRGV